MPRVAERMTEKRLRSLTKGCSCGVVPGLEVRVRTLGDGSTAKYFLLRDRATGKAYQIGQYPKVSLSDAFKTAAEWREKIKAGIDPVAERKALKKYQFCSAYRVSRASHPLMSVSRLLHYQCEGARRQAHSSLVDGNSYDHHEKKG